jgi:hypothetical protein
MLPEDLGTSDEKPKPFAPGDNPNKANALRRKIRPKVKNCEKSSSPYELKFAWADPSMGALPDIEVALEPHLESLPSGYIDLDEELPSTISQSFCDSFITLGERTLIEEKTLQSYSNNLHALCYYKAAKQLYSTMLDTDKSVCQPLKAVYYDTTPIPIHMGMALSIIGNFDSKIGPVHVRHAPTLFKRWICKGLYIDPNVSEYKELPPGNLVWKDRDGKSIADELALDYIENNRETWTPDGTTFDIQVPPIRSDTNVQRWIERLHPSTPNYDKLVTVAQILLCTEKQWIKGDIFQDNNLDGALNLLKLTIAREQYEIGTIRFNFESAMQDYYASAKPHIEALFKTGPSVAGDKGTAAQIVKSSGVQARYSIPISDSDAALGFLYSPGINFEFNPKIVAYNRRDQSVSRMKFANADLKQ